MEVATRVADRDDLAALVELYRRFRADLLGERGGAVHLVKEAFSEPLEARFSALLEDGERLVLIGLLEGVPVGTAISRLEVMPDASQLATVEVLYVDPPAREVGVGEKLLEDVLDWAAQHDADSVDVWVLPGVRESKNFLEGSGFVARLLVMNRRLA
jgi:GNAT superfamily N-acetyltransferase